MPTIQTPRITLDPGPEPFTWMLCATSESGDAVVAIKLTESELLGLALKITSTIVPERKCT